MSYTVNGAKALDVSTKLPPPTMTEILHLVLLIRDAQTQMSRNIDLLLEERTRPAGQARKYATEETVQIYVEEEDVKQVADALDEDMVPKPQVSRMDLLRRNVLKCGGYKILKKKYDAGLVSIQAYRCKGLSFKQRGHHARINIVDVTLPRPRSGCAKTFGIYCYSEIEYLALLDNLSNVLGTDLRSRHA